MCPQSCVQLEERCGREIREFAEFAEFLASKCDKEVNVGGPGDSYPLKGDLTKHTHSPNSHLTDGAGVDVGPLCARVYTRQRPQLPWPHKDNSGWARVPALGCAVPQPAPDAEHGRRGAGGGVEVLQKSRKRPWCFVNSVSKKWDYCDIPSCGESLSLSLPISPTLTPTHTHTHRAVHPVHWGVL